MLTRIELEVLRLIGKNSFLNSTNFESDNDFDCACETAQNLLDRNLICSLMASYTVLFTGSCSHTERPFTMNHTGFGSKYALAGSFSLSTDVVMRALSNCSPWTLPHLNVPQGYSCNYDMEATFLRLINVKPPNDSKPIITPIII